MNMTLKHLSLKNFCGIKDLDTDIYERTIIKGANRVGKTTILNAFHWLLTDKLVDGSSIDGIRPKDSDGNDIDHIDVIGEIILDMDGKEVHCKKSYTQDWSVNRTTMEQVFKGNKTIYEINDIPKTKKDFEAYLEQYIDLDLLALCMNPNVFLRKNNNDRRGTLFGTLIDDADGMVIATDARFEELRNDLADGTYEEIMKRSRKAIKELNDKISDRQSRLDENYSLIKELTEEERNALETELKEQKAILADFDTVSATSKELSSRINTAKIEREKIITNARLEIQKASADINAKKVSTQQKIESATVQLKDCNSRKDRYIKMVEEHVAEIHKTEESIKTLESLEFNKAELVCPTCGQDYPSDKAVEIRENFDKSKKDSLAKYNSLIDEANEKIKELHDEIERINEDCIRIQADIDEWAKELEKLDSKNVEAIDMDTLPNFVEISKQIAKWENELKSLEEKESGEVKLQVINRISQIELDLGKEKTNDVYKERIDGFNNEIRDFSQQIADEERKIDLLTEFQNKKVDMVTNEINSYFDLIKWSFYKKQINGAYAQVCEPLINGVSMDKLLNHGDKLLASLDICRAFQKKANITVPLFMDDSESVDSWRIPMTDGQLIVLKRTDDKSLVIESLA